MPLILGARRAYGPADVPEHARLAIAFIDGGMEWLRWAMGAPNTDYVFANEDGLVDGIQQGLHGERLVYLPGLKLLIGPVKLISLGVRDLRALARAEAQLEDGRGDGPRPKVLERQGLLTQDDLDQGDAFLDRILPRANALFQVKTFDDRLALWRLAHSPTAGSHLDGEAAAFAANEARTVAEFCDYFRVYLALAARGPRSDSGERRRHRAKAALQALLPLLFGALDCPSVNGLVAPAQVADAVSSWVFQGRTLGFARLSAGVRAIVESTDFTPERSLDADFLVEDYLTRSRELLQRFRLHKAAMGQDGATCTFEVRDDDHEAVLQLSPSGLITLANFARRPKVQPGAAPPDPEHEDLSLEA